MQFSFRKPHFWQPKILQKHYFDTLWHYLCYKKSQKKHYKKGEKQQKKNLDQFLTYNLDQFLTYKTPNLGPVFNSTAYIYIDTSKNVFGYFLLICWGKWDALADRGATCSHTSWPSSRTSSRRTPCLNVGVLCGQVCSGSNWRERCWACFMCHMGHPRDIACSACVRQTDSITHGFVGGYRSPLDMMFLGRWASWRCRTPMWSRFPPQHIRARRMTNERIPALEAMPLDLPLKDVVLLHTHFGTQWFSWK